MWSRSLNAGPPTLDGKFVCPIREWKLTSQSVVRWCNGSTRPFGGFCHGSNPCRTANPPERSSRLRLANHELFFSEKLLFNFIPLAVIPNRKRFQCPRHPRQLELLRLVRIRTLNLI